MAYKKGESGNLNGRPKKGHTITDAIKDLLEHEASAEIIEALKELNLAHDGDTYKQIFAATSLRKAIIEGDAAARNMIMRYIEGEPEKTINLKGALGTYQTELTKEEKQELKEEFGILKEHNKQGDND